MFSRIVNVYRISSITKILWNWHWAGLSLVLLTNTGVWPASKLQQCKSIKVVWKKLELSMMSHYKINISRPVLALGWTNIKNFTFQVHRSCMKKLELSMMFRYKVNISRPVLALGWTTIKMLFKRECIWIHINAKRKNKVKSLTKL